MEKAVPMEGPSKKQGLVYMFLQRDFQEYESRKEKDIEADIENVTRCFKNLGFDVYEPQKYCKKEKIIETLVKEYESNIWNECESIFIFFVTHSKKNGKLLCEDGSFYDEEMIKLLIGLIGEKYPDLLKVLVFQASQATEILPLPEMEYDRDEFPLGVPTQANLLVVKSSFEREASSRKHGSYFLKVFCQYLENIGNGASLFNILTAVLCELKDNRNEGAEKPRNNILPEVSSTLLKPMYLRSKGNSNFDLTRYKDLRHIWKTYRL